METQRAHRESDSDSGDEIMVVCTRPQLVGEYTCFYCSRPFNQRRYVTTFGDNTDDEEHEPKHFCLPECMAGYDWLVNGWSASTDEQRISRLEYYRKSFGRVVIPAPAHVFYDGDTCDRLKWLEQCRERLSPDEKRIADNEFYIVDMAHAPYDKPIEPDDAVVAQPAVDITQHERDAENLPSDDLFDIGTLLYELSIHTGSGQTK